LYYGAPSSLTWKVYKGFINPGRETCRSALTLYDMRTTTETNQLPPDAVPVTLVQDRTLGFTSAISGPLRPRVTKKGPIKAPTVESRLTKHEYFRSMFPADGLPSEVDIAGIVEAYATGLSVVTRCFYDPQALTHGWTVFSTLTSVKLFTVVHSRAPVPVLSSERRHILECIVQAIYSLRVIVEVHNLSGGMIVFHSNSKGTTRLLSSIKYQNVSTALDDHSDVLTELKYQLKHLVRSPTITFKYCDVEAKTGDGIPRQFVSDLGSDFNLHHADLPLPLPELPLEKPTSKCSPALLQWSTIVT